MLWGYLLFVKWKPSRSTRRFFYSALGTPYFDIAKFRGGAIPGTDILYEGLELRDAPLISSSRPKVIAKRHKVHLDLLQGGTAKDFIQMDG